MKVIIAGSRDLIYSSNKIEEFVKKAEKAFEKPVTELVCGMAQGIDRCAYNWALERRPRIEISDFPYGDYVDHAIEEFGNRKMAGVIRNRAMADYADGLILIWDGASSGSASMYEEAQKRGLPIVEVVVKKKS